MPAVRMADELREAGAAGGCMASPQPPANGPCRGRTVFLDLPVEQIAPDPAHPRRQCQPESLDRLAASIASRGMLAPLRVRRAPNADHWFVVCGQRRFHAACRAGLLSVPCLVVEGDPTESDRLHEQLVENLHREDLGPIEQAQAFRALMELGGLSATQLADELRVHKGSVTRALALLELPDSVRSHIEEGRISAAAGYELSKLGSAADRSEIAERMVAEQWTRSQTAEAVRRRFRAVTGRKRHRSTRTYNLSSGARVVIFGDEELAPAGTLAILEEALLRVREECRAECACHSAPCGTEYAAAAASQSWSSVRVDVAASTAVDLAASPGAFQISTLVPAA